MNINRKFGAGVEVMTYMTQLEIETQKMSAVLERQSEQIQKLSGAFTDLRKLVGAIDLKKSSEGDHYEDCLNRYRTEIAKMKSLMDEAIEISTRRAAAMPAYRAWATDRASVPPTIVVADKNGDFNPLGTSKQRATSQSATLMETVISRTFR